jgi:hypothetical protein
MIPRAVSNESNQDSEANLAVHPGEPRRIAGTTSITPDPGGSAFAPVFLSHDHGRTWTMNPLIPGSSLPTFGTGDVTLRFSRHELCVSELRADTGNLNVLRTPDPFSATSLQLLDSRGGPDQPYVEALTVPHGVDEGKDRAYVGYNDLSLAGATASVDICPDDAALVATFNPIVIEFRATSGQNGPAVRPAIHRGGKVYAAFFGWRPPSGSGSSDVVVVRDDHWATGPTPFRDLLDTGDGIAGQRVATNVNLNFGASLGFERIGNDLTLAVDPREARRLFIAWCDQQASGYTLHVRRSEDEGQTWSADLLTVVSVTNPSITVSEDGTVGILYQQLTGSGAAQRWETHAQFLFHHHGPGWHDHLLVTTPGNTPPPNPLIGPYLGDYTHFMAEGRDFYGAFTANNTPNLANFPHGVHYQRNADFATQTLLDVSGTTAVPISIDPFFVHIFFEEEEEREREREERRGLDRVRVRGLRYEKKLEIGELEFSLDDGARLPHEAKRDFRNLLRRVLDDLNEDDDHRRHDDERHGRHHK